MIRSATAFLPDSMMTFMNLDRSTEPNLGSGRMSRFGTSRRRGISLFLLLQLAPASRTPGRPQGRPLTRRPEGRHENPNPARSRASGRTRSPVTPWIEKALSLLRALGAVLGARLLAILDALQVERAAHDVVSHARQVLDAAAAHEHDAVLLQVVALAADVRNDLEPVRQPHLGDLAERRVRLLGRRRVDARANAAALGPALQRRRLRLDGLGLAAMADELVDRGHRTRFVARRTTPLGSDTRRRGSEDRRPGPKRSCLRAGPGARTAKPGAEKPMIVCRAGLPRKARCRRPASAQSRSDPGRHTA